MRKHTKQNVAKCITLIALSLTAFGCRGMTRTQTPVHLNPNMDNVSRCEAQESTTLFADGRCMRTPPEGTVHIGGLQDDPHMFEGRIDGEFASTLPMEMDRDLLERGHERYDIYCAPCHGEAGQGNGTVALRAQNWIIPTFHDAQRQSYPVGRIFDVITNGFSTMPSYSGQIPVEDRWAIAAYVRALQISQSATSEMLPAEYVQSRGLE